MKNHHLNFGRIQRSPYFSVVVQRAVVTYHIYISDASEERHNAPAQAELLCAEWEEI